MSMTDTGEGNQPTGTEGGDPPAESQQQAVKIDTEKWGHALVDVEIGGEVKSLPLSDVVKGHMLQSDYSTRMASLQEQQAQAQAAAEEHQRGQAVIEFARKDPIGFARSLLANSGYSIVSDQQQSQQQNSTADPYADPYADPTTQQPPPPAANAEVAELREVVNQLVQIVSGQQTQATFEQARTELALPAEVTLADVEAHMRATGITDVRTAIKTMQYDRMAELQKLDQQQRTQGAADATILSDFGGGSPPPPNPSDPPADGAGGKRNATHADIKARALAAINAATG